MGRPVPLSTRTEGNGKKQRDAIETHVGDVRIDFYLNRKTHLPVKLVTDQYVGVFRVPMTLMFRFDDYVNMDGLQMPRIVIREFVDVERRDT